MSNSSQLFSPIETKRASEAIYEQIKNKIVSGELTQGDRLPSEKSMMELFKRSRPTVREALRMLERAGYIHAIAGSNGAIITLPDEKNMQESISDAISVGQFSLAEVSEFRLVSEGASAAWAAVRAQAADIDALHACLEEMKAAISDLRAFAKLDSQFHALISKAAKNRVSELMNASLSNVNQSFVDRKSSQLTPAEQKKMNRRIQQMHEEIFEAIKDHNSAQARAAMEKHLSSFFEDLR